MNIRPHAEPRRYASAAAAVTQIKLNSPPMIPSRNVKVLVVLMDIVV